jgi:hypothetical protein
MDNVISILGFPVATGTVFALVSFAAAIGIAFFLVEEG